MAEDARGRYADEDEPPAQPDAEGPPEEYRVLFAAAEYGRADIVASAAGMLKEKLAPGEDLAEALGAARNDADESLLEKACACQKVDAVRALLRVCAMPKAAKPVAWLEEGSACRAAAHAELMQQVALGDAGRVTKLLALLGPVPRLSDAATFGGDAPLHWAASFGQEGPLAALLAAGCDVNAVNDDGVTPLHEAARAGHAPCVALLLGGGADAALRISDGPDAGKAPADLAKAEALQAELAVANPTKAGKTLTPPPSPEQSGDHEEQGAARCRAPLVWPPPRRCRLLRGAPELEFRGAEISVGIHAALDDARFDAALRTLRVEVGARFGVRVVPAAERHAVSLRICAGTTGGPEGYRVLVRGGVAAVVGHDAAGLKHGASTLAQLLRFHASCGKDGGDALPAFRLPALAVDDGPDAFVRAACLDCRGASAPRNAQVDDDARRLASWRCNALFVLADDKGCDQLERKVGRGLVEEVAEAKPAGGWFSRAPEPVVPEADPALPWHSCDGGDGYVDCDPDPGTDLAACAALSARCRARHVACIPTVCVYVGVDPEEASATALSLITRFGCTQLCVRFAPSVSPPRATSVCEAIAKSLPSTIETLWLWGAPERSEAAAARASTHASVAAILDGPPGDGCGGAKLARRRATAADALICGGADAVYATALRQAPCIASLVAAARACRAERGAGVLILAVPLGDRAPSPCFPKPFADATTLLGAGLAWRADAGADAPAAGGGRSLGQAELEALTAAHLWRLDPPRLETSAETAHDADAPRRRLAAAAAGVVCGRNERRDNNGDGRGTSLLAECQRGEHFPGAEGEALAARDAYDEALLWPPCAGGAAAAAHALTTIAAEAFKASHDDHRAATLRAHHRRLSELLRTQYWDGSTAVDPASVWKWHHDELGFFVDFERVGGDDESGLPPPPSRSASAEAVDAAEDGDSAMARLRRVVDELHVAVDLCRWVARLRQLLLARARAEAADPDDARALLASVPSTTRSDVANRLLELLQRAAALYARRHAPRDAARSAFDAAPPFLDDVTFDLANFSFDAIERLVLAATAADR